MATVIDALVVSLGLDASQFSAQQKQTVDMLRQIEKTASSVDESATNGAKRRSQAAKDATDQIKKEEKERDDAAKKRRERQEKDTKESVDQVKKVADAYSSLKREVLGYIAAVASVSGVERLLTGAVKANSAIGNASQLLGMDARNLETWRGAAERLSVSADDVVSSLRSISAEQARFRSGIAPGQDQLMAMAQLGIDPQALLGKGVSADSAERQIIAALRKKPAAERSMWAARLGVGDSAALLAGKADSEIDAAMSGARADSSNSNPAVAAARKITAAWAEFEQKFNNFTNGMLVDFEPKIEKIIGWMKEMADWATKNQIAAEAIVAALVGIGGFKAAATIAELFRLRKALVSTAAASAAAGKGGILGRIGKAGVYGAIADTVVNGVDPNDDAGSWIDNNIPGASAVDNWFATHLGIGRTYEEQGNIDGEASPRGIRNNNPGNLEFHNQTGADREEGSGRFARFKTMAEGVAALARQLQAYAARGEDTVRKIINKYAPGIENNTQAYIQNLSRKMGISADDHLDLSKIETLRGMIGGISDIENGTGKLSQDQIDSGLALFSGTGYVPSALRGRAATAVSGSALGSSSTSTTDVRIGTQNIYTQAKNGEEVVSAFQANLGSYATSSHADTGLQ